MNAKPTPRDLQLIELIRAEQGNEAPADPLAVSADWLRHATETNSRPIGALKETWHYVGSVSGGHWNVTWPDGGITILRESDDPATHKRVARWTADV
jgi:hypothetical protein